MGWSSDPSTDHRQKKNTFSQWRCFQMQEKTQRSCLKLRKDNSREKGKSRKSKGTEADLLFHHQLWNSQSLNHRYHCQTHMAAHCCHTEHHPLKSFPWNNPSLLFPHVHPHLLHLHHHNHPCLILPDNLQEQQPILVLEMMIGRFVLRLLLMLTQTLTNDKNKQSGFSDYNNRPPQKPEGWRRRHTYIAEEALHPVQ